MTINDYLSKVQANSMEYLKGIIFKFYCLGLWTWTHPFSTWISIQFWLYQVCIVTRYSLCNEITNPVNSHTICTCEIEMRKSSENLGRSLGSGDQQRNISWYQSSGQRSGCCRRRNSGSSTACIIYYHTNQCVTNCLLSNTHVLQYAACRV